MTRANTGMPLVDDCQISFPIEHVMLVTLNRPKKMNAMTKPMHWQLSALWDWYDLEPSLRSAIITGAGTKAFCAGSDLLEIEINEKKKLKDPGNIQRAMFDHPTSGFAGMSRRKGKKPIIAAVNGLALGGGFEIVLNCDIVVASPTAQFGLPEPLVGVYASGAGLPRLMRNCGLAVASDIALTGRRVTAQEAFHRGLVSHVSKSPASVLDEALEKARQVAGISPDAIYVTRAGLRQAWETASVDRAYTIVHEELNPGLIRGENHYEGLAAFREKRKPVWRDSKL